MKFTIKKLFIVTLLFGLFFTFWTKCFIDLKHHPDCTTFEIGHFGAYNKAKDNFSYHWFSYQCYEINISHLTERTVIPEENKIIETYGETGLETYWQWHIEFFETSYRFRHTLKEPTKQIPFASPY